MTEPISEQPPPELLVATPAGTEPQAQSPFTPIPQGSGMKWGRVAALLVVCLMGVAWGLGWLEQLIDSAAPVLRPVTGTARYNGKPLTSGFVRTIYERGNVMGTLGPIKPDGSFELMTNGDPGAYSGRHRVLVLCMDGGMPPKSTIPEKYSDPRQTPFSIYVLRSGPNTLQLELEDAKTP